MTPSDLGPVDASMLVRDLARGWNAARSDAARLEALGEALLERAWLGPDGARLGTELLLLADRLRG